MWIGGIRLTIETKDQRYASTDSLVTATILRDGMALGELILDDYSENNLEKNSVKTYNYWGPTRLPRRNDRTPELPGGFYYVPSPYPGYGFEFSCGLNDHLSIELNIKGKDMWIKDKVDLYLQFIRLRNTGYHHTAWVEDPHWSYIASWSKSLKMSKDLKEGTSSHVLTLT